MGLGREVCSSEWVGGNIPAIDYIAFDSRSTQGAIATDAAGNILVAATHTGTAFVGGMSFPTEGNNIDSLVVKFDSSTVNATSSGPSDSAAQWQASGRTRSQPTAIPT